MKKILKDGELAERIKKIQEKEKIDFFENYNNDEGIGFCAEYVNFFDSHIILIGGYANNTHCINVSNWWGSDEDVYNEILAGVQEFFKYYGLKEIIIND